MSNLDNCLNSYQKWFIGNEVRTILLSNSGITSGITDESGVTIFNGVGTNIFPLVAPEDVKGDFIIYGREKYSKSWTKMGVYQDECQLSITVVTDNYDNGILLASLIDNALVGRQVDSKGREFFVDLADSTESFDDDKYIETLLLRIK